MTRTLPLAVLRRSLLLGTCLVAFAMPATAALIDITVIGTWEAASPDPNQNPFGLVNNDRFVMKATYDDTTLFNGGQGVTAVVDPSVNAGTSFKVILPYDAVIPQPGGTAPNPYVFTHDDHTFLNVIGYAENAEIEFTGSDATTDPGSFRNFEIHVDFPFLVNGDEIDLDLYQGALNVTSEWWNISHPGLAATGSGDDHLEVVTNDVTANAGGPYVFDAANLTRNTNGTSGGGNGFGKTYDWTGPNGAFDNSPGANISFDLVDAGLTHTTDSTSVSLVVTEDFTEFASAPAMANASYNNAAPQLLSASATSEVDLSITFSATADDDDLVANAIVTGFETTTIEFLYDGNVFLSGAGTSLMDNLDVATLLGIFGGEGIFAVVARVTDLAGVIDSTSFNVEVVPEPGTLALLALGLAGVALQRRHA